MTKEKNFNLDDLKLSSEQVKGFLGKFKDQDLESHYVFKQDITCVFKKSSDVDEFLKKNTPITIEIKGGEIYYTISGDEAKDELFTVDTESSFSKSNEWFYSKIIKPDLVYPNIGDGAVSNEMTSFYICLIISSVLGGNFKTEFLEVVETYNFETWSKAGPDAFDFFTLSGEWIQMGSETVKMIAAAAKFALTKSSKKKELPLQLDIPQDLDLKYKNLIKEVADVRWTYDNKELSPENRRNMSRLDVKIKVREQNKIIEDMLKKDSDLHKIWRLLNLNSNVIDPSVKRGFTIQSRKYSTSVFKDLFGYEYDRENNFDVLALKKIQDKLRKEAIRACLNKIFSDELSKFNADPVNYWPPNFV